MKIMNRIFLAALILAVFAAISCDSTVSVTSMNQDNVKKELSQEEGNDPFGGAAIYTFLPSLFAAGSGATYGSATSSGLNALAGATYYDLLTLTFPNDRRLDVLAIPNGIGVDGKVNFTAFQEKLRKAIHFYPLENKTLADTTLNTVANAQGAELAYTVERRDNNVVTIRLLGLDASMQSIIEVFFDAQEYTYANGLKLDVDGNGVPGEAWFDDIYRYITIAGTTAAAYTTNSGGRNPQAGFSISAVWRQNNTNVTGGTGGHFNLDPAQAISLRVTYSGVDAAITGSVSRANDIKDKLILEKYNRDKHSWEDISSTLSLTRSGISGDYDSGVGTVASTDMLRVRIRNVPGQEYTVEGPYYGGEQRHYASNKKIPVNTLISVNALTQNNNTQLASGTPFSSITYGSDADGRNAYILLTFATGVVGDQGITLPSTTADPLQYTKYLKVGYNGAASLIANPPQDGTIASTPAGWDTLVFVPIKSAELRKSSFTNTFYDQLKIFLDPEYRKVSTDRLHIIINKGLGTLGNASGAPYAKPFGNVFNVTPVIDGEYGFVCYGSTIN
ncbi:hypothetical protein AGMMS50293_06880 [Spirochaetia bacterium]|nr:hypothetical protein AGMMS50293_06880 [Spirochaetia bacterium]